MWVYIIRLLGKRERGCRAANSTSKHPSRLSHVEIEISIRRIVSKTLLRPSVVFIIIVSGAKFYWMVGRLILSAITEWTGVSNAVI